jgi:hypothetical protein
VLLHRSCYSLTDGWTDGPVLALHAQCPPTGILLYGLLFSNNKKRERKFVVGVGFSEFYWWVIIDHVTGGNT